MDEQIDALLLGIQLTVALSDEGPDAELNAIITDLRNGTMSMDSGVVVKISDLAMGHTYPDEQDRASLHFDYILPLVFANRGA